MAPKRPPLSGPKKINFHIINYTVNQAAARGLHFWFLSGLRKVLLEAEAPGADVKTRKSQQSKHPTRRLLNSYRWPKATRERERSGSELGC